MKTATVVLALAFGVASGLDNGLGRTPPMGWRSWKLYGADVNQTLIEGIMEGMVSKVHAVRLGLHLSCCW